jgi:hypothetical protein
MGHYSKHARLSAGLIQGDRWQIDRTATIRFWSGAAAGCLLTNISRKGYRMRCRAPLISAQTIWLEMNGCDPLHSKVIWSEDEIAGCGFLTPLAEAIYSKVIRSSIGPDRLGDDIYI